MSKIVCNGDKSCSEAIIQGDYSEVEVTARLGALNTLFITQSPNVDFKFTAALSEYNATVICSNNCTFYCVTSKCRYLNYQCSDNNPNCIFRFSYISDSSLYL